MSSLSRSLPESNLIAQHHTVIDDERAAGRAPDLHMASVELDALWANHSEAHDASPLAPSRENTSAPVSPVTQRRSPSPVIAAPPPLPLTVARERPACPRRKLWIRNSRSASVIV